MKNIDKIVLSSCKTKCVVHLISGPSLHFNFTEMKMTWSEGLKWLEGIFSGANQYKEAA